MMRLISTKSTKNGKCDKKYRWGIVGTGRMANTFCKVLAQAENAEITAVCSRTLKNAQKFAGKFGIDAAYDNVIELASDENVQDLRVHLNYNQMM